MKYQLEIDEGVERVGLARRAAAAARAVDMLPGRMAVERVAGRVEVDVLGQHDRQLVARHRHRAAVRAMDDRDRRAPVALARDAPVAQAILDGAVAPARRFGAADDFGRGLLGRQPVEELGIDRDSRRAFGLVADRLGRDIGARRDDALDRQIDIASQIRSRAGRGRERRKSRRCRNPSARSSRCRPAAAIRDRAGGRPRPPVRKPFFSAVSISAALVPPALHSAMNSAALASVAATACAIG